MSFLTGLISHHASIEDQFLTDTELPSFSATFSQLSRISAEPRELVEVMDNSNNVANIQPSSTSYRGRGRGPSAARGGGLNASQEWKKGIVTIVK